MIDKETLEQKADEILEKAKETGLETNFFFVTTFDRYLVQLRILQDLEKHINEDGAMVTKAYVKGRENLYTNPAITEYNRTVTAANKTVSTLQSILKDFGSLTGEGKKEDAMMAFLNE